MFQWFCHMFLGFSCDFPMILKDHFHVFPILFPFDFHMTFPSVPMIYLSSNMAVSLGDSPLGPNQLEPLPREPLAPSWPMDLQPVTVVENPWKSAWMMNRGTPSLGNIRRYSRNKPNMMYVLKLRMSIISDSKIKCITWYHIGHIGKYKQIWGTCLNYID